MSELINKCDNRATIRWKLLTGVSAFALMAYVSTTGAARAEDGQPQVWIELGGQLSRLEDAQEKFSPSLFATRPSIFSPSEKFQTPPRLGIDAEGKISFQPNDSDWVFSASLRYGRSSSKKHVHEQTYPVPFVLHYISGGVLGTWSPYAAKFADTNSQMSERHTIVDFQVGKDVGLGMLGSKGGTSVLSGGIRFAQFTAKSNIALKSDPDWHMIYTYVPFFAYYFTQTKFPVQQPYHSNLASSRAQRSFSGVGPSISWNASMPLAGNTQDGAVELEWGLNAAVLFGRQKAQTHHQTTARYGYGYFRQHRITRYSTSTNHTRSRNVMVPNVGGFAGLSFRYVDAKISLGYKADFFFGAIDGGIDAAKKENRGFNGPYASVSIGIGD